MQCKTCKKNIDALNFFTKKIYCSKECEQKDDKPEEDFDFSSIFGGFKK